MKNIKKDIVIYQTSGGAIELRGDVKKETIWATQVQMADIFGVNSQAITKHLKNVYAEGELDENSTCSKMEQVQKEGARMISRSMLIYNLDAIISVGYRINSKKGTAFRRWATKVLREHITKGYTINPARVKKNYNEFLSAVEKVKSLLPANLKPDTESILELVKVFADTWFSLDSYDKEVFGKGKITKKKISLKAEELFSAILEFKAELIKKSEATDIFALERSAGYVEGIIGNVMQSFGGKELYPSLEEKAAHLLYFMIKNHPFVDGNKRSGAFSFVWFLKKSGGLDTSKITPAALTALTLLIAESNPKEKDKMTSLVAMILRK
jgi:prophage maintenance system killer protein